jgi:SAM-dependent methyltransferase
MIRYMATALALKCFSATTSTRGIYRALGNRLGDRRRRAGAMPSYYPERLRRMLRLDREFKIVKHGDRILELGTGWLHWEAMTLRLFCDVRSVLYDVWDNRQLGGLKNYVRQLGAMLGDGFDLTPAELERARSLIEKIGRVESFDELYGLLNFEYVVEETGSLSRFVSESFQLVVSGGVLEHVPREALPMLMKETFRVLKPGGWAVHSIDTSDHLSHYDPSVNKKRYVAFSETTWRLLCDNHVQAINRVQRGEWLELFRSPGFEFVEEEYREVDISCLKIAPRFAGMDRRDLATTVVRLTLRKPGPSSPATFR